MRNHILKPSKIIAVMLAALFMAGTGNALAFAEPASDETAGESLLSTTSQMVTRSAEAGKEETVYVLTDASGAAQDVIVSEWLKNPDGKSSLPDETLLQNIKNVKGDETYDSASHTWSANGSDIYYQGTTDRQLPVEMSVAYQLDGKKISADELAGKSGRVTMRFTYQNRQKQKATIDGKEEELYVPFVVLTGTILDNSKFTNIQVSNGKLVNDGDRSIVMGFALPGMQENLGVSAEKFEIPEEVTITADVTDFSLDTTLTLATNEVFNELELSDVNSVADLTSALRQLSDSSKQLVDGSSELYDGLSTLLDQSGSLISGVDQLDAGAGTLQNGIGSLQSGASELQNGIGTLSGGLQKLSGSSAALRSGSESVFQSLLSIADEQLAAAGLSVPKLTISNYTDVLNGVLAKLDRDTVYQMAYNTALEKVTAAVKAQESVIRSKVEAAARDQVLAGVLQAAGQQMTAEQYRQAVAAGMISAQMQAQVSDAVEAQMASAAMQATIDQKTEEQMQALIQQNMQSSDVQSQITAAVSQAEAGQSSLAALKTQLDSYREFYTGLQAYTAGVDEAYTGSVQLDSGAGRLVDGIGQLSSGAQDLKNGTSALKNGGSALKDGVTQLCDGAMQLRDGMKQFDEEGIQKLVDVFDGDFKGLLDRLKAIAGVSKEYQNFGGKADDVSGSVRFIFRTASIG